MPSKRMSKLRVTRRTILKTKARKQRRVVPTLQSPLRFVPSRKPRKPNRTSSIVFSEKKKSVSARRKRKRKLKLKQKKQASVQKSNKSWTKLQQ